MSGLNSRWIVVIPDLGQHARFLEEQKINPGERESPRGRKDTEVMPQIIISMSLKK